MGRRNGSKLIDRRLTSGNGLWSSAGQLVESRSNADQILGAQVVIARLLRHELA